MTVDHQKGHFVIAEPMKRGCGTCGANIIPYPLSSRRDCGDPMYSNFQCDTSTGQVNFVAPGGPFRVTNINPEQKIFSIQIINCTKENEVRNFLQLNHSLPYKVIRGCSSEQNNLASDIGFVDERRHNELEIQWTPPLRPVCETSINCTDWPNSSCSNVTEDGARRCTCNELFHWNPENFTCISGEDTTKFFS